MSKESEAPVSYTTLTDDELIDALYMAGRKPERELIEACLERQESLTPILLDLVLDEGDEEWDEDDPRWYIGIHVGMLLIAFREPAAIPIFIDTLKDDWYENLFDWFSEHLHHYGPAIASFLLEIVADEEELAETRIRAISILTQIASRFMEMRQRVTVALRALLPPLENGAIHVDNPTEDDVDLWTWAADGLGELGDRYSLPIVEALHNEGLIDERVYGDFDDYKREFFSPKGFRYHRRKEAFDIFKVYRYENNSNE